MLDSTKGGTILKSAPRPSETRVSSTHQPPNSAVLDSSGVEIWFGIFQCKMLNNVSFRNIDQLIGAIHAFTAAYNEKAAPFAWRK